MSDNNINGSETMTKINYNDISLYRMENSPYETMKDVLSALANGATEFEAQSMVMTCTRKIMDARK